MATPLEVVASQTAGDSVDAAGNTVSYDAHNVLDGDPETAWRTKGDEIGETIFIEFEQAMRITGVGMIPGYAKVDPADGTNRFYENRSVQSARFTFDDGSERLMTFMDEPRLQSATVDVYSQTVLVEILSTSEPGSRNYVAISEIDIVVE